MAPKLYRAGNRCAGSDALLIMQIDPSIRGFGAFESGRQAARWKDADEHAGATDQFPGRRAR
jgi:hypothetical protein